VPKAKRGFLPKLIEWAFPKLHLDVSAMSTCGVNEIVPNSGHCIQYGRPQVVIDAVDQAVNIARENVNR
jgi:hypothetical protein